MGIYKETTYNCKEPWNKFGRALNFYNTRNKNGKDTDLGFIAPRLSGYLCSLFLASSLYLQFSLRPRALFVLYFMVCKWEMGLLL